jgi:hypothetical protein
MNADRSALIRLASTLPKGSEERRAILAGLDKRASLDKKAGFPHTEIQQMEVDGMNFGLRLLCKEVGLSGICRNLLPVSTLGRTSIKVQIPTELRTLFDELNLQVYVHEYGRKGVSAGLDWTYMSARSGKDEVVRIGDVTSTYDPKQKKVQIGYRTHNGTWKNL